MDTITRQPCARTNLVPRVALLDLLEASGQTAVTVVQAPPGYGKTTLLAQWADRDPRQFAWLTIDQRDNDPSVLLRKLDGATDALAAAPVPAVLVLDDLHLLQNRDCQQAVGELIDHLPTGSQLAVAS